MTKLIVPDREFPRGGTKTKRGKTLNAEFSIFKKTKTKKVGNKKKQEVLKPKPKNGKPKSMSKVRDLVASEIRPGMCVLGCVQKVTEFTVELSIPGPFKATVSVANINSAYTSMIESNSLEVPTLSELFKLGDEHPVQLLDAADRFGMYNGSLNPRHVNSKLTLQHLQKHLIINAAVMDVEEHGAVIDLGLHNVTAFMLKKNYAPDQTYIKGQLISVCITELPQGRTVQVFDSKVMNKEKHSVKLPIHCMIPGIGWKLIVMAQYKGGLLVGMEGFNDEVQAFIHQDYLAGLFDDVEMYQVGTEVYGTLLYVLPILNHPYFKINSNIKPKWTLPLGSVEKVQVVKSGPLGIFGKVKWKDNNPIKCFIPRQKIACKSSVIKTKYTPGIVLERVRIEWPVMMKRFYLGAMNKASLANNLYSKNDLNIGQTLTCKILVDGAKYCTVEISPSLKGFVPIEQITENPVPSKKFKPGTIVKARVLTLPEGETRTKLTLKPTLVNTKKVLTEKSKPNPDETYPGFVRLVKNYKILVEFFGGFVVAVPKERLPLGPGELISTHYTVGQVVNCYVVKGSGKQIVMSLFLNQNVKDVMKVGKSYNAQVSRIGADGLYLDVETKSKRTCPGFLPTGLLSGHAGLAQLQTKLSSIGDILKVTCVNIDSMKNPPCLLANHPVINYYCKKNKIRLKAANEMLVVGNILPFVVLRAPTELAPVVPHDGVQLPLSDNKAFKTFQVVMGKIQAMTNTGVLTCTTDVNDVWDHRYQSSLELLASFVNECEKLQNKITQQHSLGGLKLGDKIEGTVKDLKETTSILKLKSRKKTIAKCNTLLKLNGHVTGRISWIDYGDEVVWIQPLPDNETWPTKSEKRGNIRARVIYTSQDVIVADSVSSHELVFIPTRRHFNDFQRCELAYKVGEVTKLTVHRIGSKLFGIDKKAARINERRLMHEQLALEVQNKKKRKIEEADEPTPGSEKRKKNEVATVSNGDDCEVVGELVKSSSTVEEYQDVKEEVLSDEDLVPLSQEPVSQDDDDSDAEIKQECDSRDGMETSINVSDSESEEEEIKPMPMDLEVGFDWSVDQDLKLLTGSLDKKNDESSSDDEEVDPTENKKTKRLTGSEKREKARETEERLRAKEAALVDPTRPPESADDFDRLVVSTPDDSSIWLKYMAFHLENTEIEKARAVAKRALKVISFREEQEKLNVWLALMNLEQLYGSVESQNQVLEEALRCNEPYKIYLHKLNGLVDSSAGLEAEKLSNVLLKKYGSNAEVWCEVGEAVMRLGKIDFARTVLQRGMSSLPNSKHVPLITKFAQMENKYGSSERAQTLYEHVLTAFPKRVDVWSAYVDLMVKSGRIDLARQILERSVSQSIPPKKMKVLFKKFLSFEETHGTPENAEKVRQAAAEFIDSAVNA